MRKRILLLMALLASLGVCASEFDAKWKLYDKYERDDMPRKAVSVLAEITEMAERRNVYDELLAAEFSMVRTMASISPDSVSPAMIRLRIKADRAWAEGQQDSRKAVLATVYATVLQKWQKRMTEREEEKLKARYADAERERHCTALPEADSCVMRSAALLASVRASAYRRIVDEGKDDAVYSNDMLSVLGHELGMHAFLEQHYLAVGNRRAACLEARNAIDGGSGVQSDNAYTMRREALRDAMERYADVPESAFLAEAYYNTIAGDGDITDATRYRYLLDAKSRYGALCRKFGVEKYLGWTENSMASLTAPQFSVSIGMKNVVLSGIRNIGNLEIVFSRVKADGREKFELYDSKQLRKLKSLTSATPSATLSRHYSTPSYELHDDTLGLPPLPYGVYLVTAKGNGQEEYAVFCHSGLALLFLPYAKDKERVVCVSSATGRPVPGAEIMMLRSRRRGEGSETVGQIVADKNGEAVIQAPDDVDAYYVRTSDDDAFSTAWHRPYFSVYKRVQQNDVLTACASRSIYRPGQRAEGVVMAYNAADDNAVRSVAGKQIVMNVYDADRKLMLGDTIVTDSCGNAPFSFVIPKGAKSGRAEVRFTAPAAVSDYLSFRIEEYRRPTFSVEPVGAERFEETLVIPDTLPTSIALPSSKVDVVFKAVTYSGIPVRSAKVSYTVKRRPVWRCWGMGGEERTLCTNTTATTSADGTVAIPLCLSLPERSMAPYMFTVAVSVTDMNGETQTSSVSLRCRHASRNDSDAAPLADGMDSQTPEPFTLSAKSFPAGGKVTLTLRRTRPSLNAAPVMVYYSLLAENKVIEQSACRLDTLYKRQFAYREEYGAGLTIAYAWMEDATPHVFSATIQKPRPDMTLHPRWTVFRDRTCPGSEETWTLSLAPADMPVRNATLTATLYDKSLDAIMPHKWSFTPQLSWYSVSASWRAVLNDACGISVSIPADGVPSAYSLEYASLNRLVQPGYSVLMSLGGRNVVTIRGGAIMMDNALYSKPMAVGKTLMAKRATEELADAKADVSDAGTEGVSDSMENLAALVRKDMSEQGFFIPSLPSSADGTFTMSFRMPETMTTWRLVGLVHDSRMRYAVVDTAIVSSKDIIVRPNVPRFLREGDSPLLKTSVENATGRSQKVETIVQLSRPDSTQPFWQASRTSHIGADATVTETFKMPEIESDTLLILRVVSRTAEGFSDGEQHLVTVLPDMETVTRTFAFTHHSEGHYEYDVENLVDDASVDRTMTVTYTPDAAGMIASAVPSAVAPSSSDAMSLATASYISHLLGVADTASASRQLADAQLADGSWAWWQGMQGSVHTTVAVARLLARLHSKAQHDALTDSMLMHAMPYLAKHLADETADMRTYQRKHPKEKLCPSETLCNIVYIMRLSGCQLSASVRRDMDYVVSLLDASPASLTIYGKAQTAVILALSRRMASARRHLRSLLEYSVCTAEAGRYFDSPRAHYSWRSYRIPTVVAAIEAVAMAMPDSVGYIDDMKRWLLHERRTQQWDTTLDTADAIYAFLSGTEHNDAKDADEAESYAVSYRKQDGESESLVSGKAYSIDSATGTVAIDKYAPHTSWGSICVTQRVALSKFAADGNGIGFTIHREVILPDGRAVPEGDVSQLCAEGSRVKVRLTVVAERDCDFVVVTDNRAASLSPVNQLSGYRRADTEGTARGSYSGYYQVTGDNATHYYFDRLAKGTHVIETEYHVDRGGRHASGTASVVCEYAPEFSAVER